MKEINLEEILKKSMGKNPNKYVFIAGDNASVEKCLKAMEEACKKVLELAVENVCEIDYIETGPMDESVLESITNTINQVK